jgi:hypothetical protein
LAACSSRATLSPAGGGGGGAGTVGGSGAADLPGQTVDRNLDVLLMIDNSTNMTYEQVLFVERFSNYVSVLRALPGGLPNLHVGIVTSSLGAGRSADIPSCPPGGDRGVLQTKPLGITCERANLAGGQTFIVDGNGAKNYTGDLADMVACIGMVGEAGCGFEHQLASISRALGADGQPPPPENTGFLRPDAYLQIVVVSDEDDCSAPPDADLFDTSSELVSDRLGPLQSYRCNEFGHLCAGKPPPRTLVSPPVDLSGTCVSNENGPLLHVADLVKQLKGLKNDPSRVFVAAISAPPNPYVVALRPPEIKTDPSQWPSVQHSCSASNGIYGDPAVRTKQWVDAFGANGLFQSLCADDFGPLLSALGEQAAKALGGP